MPYESYREVSDFREATQEEKIYLTLASTLLTPVGWGLFGATTGAFALWKLRQALLVGSVLYDEYSSGGGGPGESTISTTTPPLSLEQMGAVEKQGTLHDNLFNKASRNSRSLAARSVSSAHGGRRSGSKPRKRCPTGFRWNGRRCVKY